METILMLIILMLMNVVLIVIVLLLTISLSVIVGIALFMLDDTAIPKVRISKSTPWRVMVMCVILTTVPLSLAYTILIPWSSPMVACDFVMAGGTKVMTLRAIIGIDTVVLLLVKKTKVLVNNQGWASMAGVLISAISHRRHNHAKFSGHPKATGITGIS